MKNLLLIFITISSVQVNGQNLIPNAEADYINFHKLISEKKFESALSYMNEDILKLVSKEKLISQFEQSFNKNGVSFESTEPKIINQSELNLIGEDYYIKFTAVSNLEVIDTSINKNEINEHTKNVEKVYGIGNVSYDENKNTFIILIKKYVVGKFSTNQKNWRFITTKDKSKFEKMKFLPQEILRD